MLKQSLDAQIAVDQSDMKAEKASKAKSEEAEAEASGDLEMATKELTNAKKTLATAQSKCMKIGGDHEMTVKTRGEELKVIAEAKKIVVENFPGAVEQT